MQKAPILIEGLIIFGLLLSAMHVQAYILPPITDPKGDVMTLTDLEGNSKVVTSSPYVTIANIDITNATYTDNAGSATVSMTVAGVIENRGKIPDPNSEDVSDYLHLNAIEYRFDIETTTSAYSITYANHTCQLMLDNGDTQNLTTYSVTGNTLTVTFSFQNTSEKFSAYNVTTDFVKFNFTSLEQLENITDDQLLFEKYYIDYTDTAPNQALAISEVSAETNLASPGRNIQFNCTIETMTGMPPYTYHWSFGDGTSSDLQNPIHAYTRTGDFTYTCTVTDQNHAQVSDTGQIKIQGNSGSNTGGSSNMVLIFIAIIVIIAIAGVAIVVYLIRR